MRKPRRARLLVSALAFCAARALTDAREGEPAALQPAPFVGDWVLQASKVGRAALAQLASSAHPGRPVAPAAPGGFSNFFGEAIRILGNVLRAATAQMNSAKSTFTSPKPDHNKPDQMLGGLMGYGGPFQLGLDEPGLRNDPFTQMGLGDECAFHLNHWLTRCEWGDPSQTVYLQLASGTPGRPGAPGGEDFVEAAKKGIPVERSELRMSDADQEAVRLAAAKEAAQTNVHVHLPEFLKARQKPGAEPAFAWADAVLKRTGADPSGGRPAKQPGSMPAEAEECWKEMSYWLNRCVLNPI